MKTLQYINTYSHYWEEANFSHKIIIFFSYFLFFPLWEIIGGFIFWFVTTGQLDFAHYYFTPLSLAVNFLTLIFPILIPLLLNSFFEEIIFRLPLSFIFKKVKNYNARLISITMSCFLFGVYHVLSYSNPDPILILEVMLLKYVAAYVFVIFYLVVGGVEGKIAKPLILVSLLHFLVDVFILSAFGLPSFMK